MALQSSQECTRSTYGLQRFAFVVVAPLFQAFSFTVGPGSPATGLAKGRKLLLTQSVKTSIKAMRTNRVSWIRSVALTDILLTMCTYFHRTLGYFWIGRSIKHFLYSNVMKARRASCSRHELRHVHSVTLTLAGCSRQLRTVNSALG